MDLFMQDQVSRGALPTAREQLLAFAARQVVAMRKGLRSAPLDIQNGLQGQIRIESLWALALILGGWEAGRNPSLQSSAIQGLLTPYGVEPLWGQLDLFAGTLTPFTETAQKAQDEAALAAAGSYFVSAVQSIGVSLLSSMLQSESFRRLTETLHRAFPQPAELQACFETERMPPVHPASLPPARPPARQRSFDRADFRARTQPQSARTERTVEMQTLQPLPQPPPLDLDNEAITRAYLHMRGWSETDVAYFLKGPGEG